MAKKRSFWPNFGAKRSVKKNCLVDLDELVRVYVIRGIEQVHVCRKADSFMQRRLLLSPPPSKKKILYIEKNMPIPELHTAPALSHLCGIFLPIFERFTIETRQFLK